MPKRAPANTYGGEAIDIDTTVAHTSRVYDYLLGGTNNFAVDRAVAENAFATYPGGLDGVRADARANRGFLVRSVRYLAREAGVRQFLDIGTGIPNADNTHAVAQAVSPDARVVYVDNDPIVLAHAHQLLSSAPDGVTAYVQGDVRTPARILQLAADTLDFTEPVALVLVGLLHVIPDAADPHGIVATLVDAVVPGSYLAISHMTNDPPTGVMAEVTQRLDRAMHRTNPPALRSEADVRRFLAGLELVEPGVVEVDKWRPEGGGSRANHGRATPVLGGVARK
ncbi:MAG: SAM-dependent methyltransferase [Acidimicrobiales bacterium]